MYYLLGLQENIKTLFLLARTTETENKITNYPILKNKYLQFLNKIQPTIWHPSSEESKFLYDPDIINKLLIAFTQDSILSDHNSIIEVASKESMDNALDRIYAAINFMHVNHPDLFLLFDLCINTLFYAMSKNDGGGSISAAIGIIWCANRKTWTLMDCLELLIHEMTHTLVFLDELRFQHYLDFNKMTEKENFAISAILNVPRPLDKAFHRLMVACEILQLRLGFIGEPVDPKVHPPSRELLNSARETLISINDTIKDKSIASKRVEQLLEIANESLFQSEKMLYQMQGLEFLAKCS